MMVPDHREENQPVIKLPRIFSMPAGQRKCPPETVPSQEEVDKTLKESLERGRESNRALAAALGWDDSKIDAYFPST